MKLKQLAQSFAILKLPVRSPIPEWAMTGKFFSISKTNDELSVVCEDSLIPEGFELKSVGWTCLRVEGLLDFAQTGILSSIAGPLAKSKISIFAISTYDTDYILVKSENLEVAKEALKKSGFTL